MKSPDSDDITVNGQHMAALLDLRIEMAENFCDNGKGKANAVSFFVDSRLLPCLR